MLVLVYVICYCGFLVEIDEKVRTVKLIQVERYSRASPSHRGGSGVRHYSVRRGPVLACPQFGQNFDWACRFDPQWEHDTTAEAVETIGFTISVGTRPPRSLELNIKPAIKTSTAFRKI